MPFGVSRYSACGLVILSEADAVRRRSVAGIPATAAPINLRRERPDCCLAMVFTPCVVPANAGTHNHRAVLQAGLRPQLRATISICGYGSRVKPGTTLNVLHKLHTHSSSRRRPGPILRGGCREGDSLFQRRATMLIRGYGSRPAPGRH